MKPELFPDKIKPYILPRPSGKLIYHCLGCGLELPIEKLHYTCPKCGQVAYAQPVCPNCSKGRAGIRTEYICGECNFVFYV